MARGRAGSDASEAPTIVDPKDGGPNAIMSNREANLSTTTLGSNNSDDDDPGYTKSWEGKGGSADPSDYKKPRPVEDDVKRFNMDLGATKMVDMKPAGSAGPAGKSAAPAGEQKDPNMISWDGPNDPTNPKNWPSRQKWMLTFMTSMFAFIGPVSSSMVAPGLRAISIEFHITNTILQQMTLSMFVLAFAVGPIFLGPISEVHGRAPVLLASNFFFVIFNTACGAAQSSNQMIAFRFFAGLGGSAPLAVGGAVLTDIWTPDNRGKAISIYSLMPLLGPAIGPICGGFIVQYNSWRWCFYSVSIAGAVIQVFTMFYMKETFARAILQKKVKKLRKETGNENLYTIFDKKGSKVSEKIKLAFFRPYKLLTTQPIVQMLSLYMGFLFGLMYLVLATFPSLWVLRYHETPSIGALNYLSAGIGFFVGSQVCAPLSDRIYRSLKIKNGGKGCPEFRVPLMVPGSIIVPIGIFIYGWTAQHHAFWFWPNLGVCLFSGGMILCFQAIQSYFVEAYQLYAASALAALTIVRSLAGFGFPLFAPYMYKALDYGWGNSLLGFLGIAIGWPAPFILWKYGAVLRAKSTFAVG